MLHERSICALKGTSKSNSLNCQSIQRPDPYNLKKALRAAARRTFRYTGTPPMNQLKDMEGSITEVNYFR